MNVFAYGTLMVPEIFEKVTGRPCRARDAVLRGYARYRVSDAPYPGIVPQAGGATDGILYPGLDAEAVALLDAFEGNLYERIDVTVLVHPKATRPAQAYVVRISLRHRLTDLPWCLEEFQKNDQSAFIRSFSGFNRCADAL